MPVREATEADLPRLVELLDQLTLDVSREDVSPQVADVYTRALRAIAGDETQRLLVLEDGGEIVASLVLIITPNLTHRGKPYATIENVVVDEAARGGGHGRELMQYATEQAKTAGCYKVQLTSHKARSEAHKFYESLGFESTHVAYRIQLED